MGASGRGRGWTLGSKVGANFSHRGYTCAPICCARRCPERGIQVRLNPDAVFEFPYGDGYWSKLAQPYLQLRG